MNPAQFKSYLTRRTKSESQAAIARDFGVTQQAVSLWLNGKRPAPLTVRLLAQSLQNTPKAA